MSESDTHTVAPPAPLSAAPEKSTAVASAKPQAAQKPRPKHLPPYHVVLLDDDDHSYEYVIEMLKSLFGHKEEEGFRLAKEVDRDGRSVVFTTHKELAELKRDQIHSFGKDLRVASCAGAMSARIEPAETGN
jgi:ATP-dependent Clp protease adaptor protein ClpS